MPTPRLMLFSMMLGLPGLVTISIQETHFKKIHLFYFKIYLFI